MSQQHRILGFDPSLESMGWALMTVEGKLLASGARSPRIKDHGDEHLAATFDLAIQAGELVVEHRPTLVYAERCMPAKGGGQKNVRLDRLSGAIAFAVWLESRVSPGHDTGIETAFYYPQTWRSKVGLKPNKIATKKKTKTGKDKFEHDYKTPALAMVLRNWDHEAISHDAAEAILVAFAGVLEVADAPEFYA